MAKNDTPVTTPEFEVRVIGTQIAPGPDERTEVCQVSAICETVQIGFLTKPDQAPTVGDVFVLTLKKKGKTDLVVAPKGAIPGT